jgi:hypothetical protein
VESEPNFSHAAPVYALPAYREVQYRLLGAEQPAAKQKKAKKAKKDRKTRKARRTKKPRRAKKKKKPSRSKPRRAPSRRPG